MAVLLARWSIWSWPFRINAAVLLIYALLMLTTRSFDPVVYLYERHRAAAFDKHSRMYEAKIEALGTRGAIEQTLHGWSQQRINRNAAYYGCALGLRQPNERDRQRLAGCYTIIYRLRDEAEVRVLYERDGRYIRPAQFWAMF